MILVTGGTGYIGSHTCVAPAQAGHDIVNRLGPGRHRGESLLAGRFAGRLMQVAPAVVLLMPGVKTLA